MDAGFSFDRYVDALQDDSTSHLETEEFLNV